MRLKWYYIMWTEVVQMFFVPNISGTLGLCDLVITRINASQIPELFVVACYFGIFICT